MRQMVTYNIGAGSANGLVQSKTIYCADFRNAVFSVTAASSANLTLKVYGSVLETKPDFTASASATNQWSTMQVINLDNGSPVDGATGLVFTGAGTDGTKSYEVNTNAVNWIGFVISGYSAGTVTLTLTMTDNE